jgi:Fe-S-cluster containining protein
MNYSYEEIDTIFFDDGYRLAREIIGKEISNEKFILLTKALYENIDKLIDAFSLRVNQSDRRIDCKKACSWCCSQMVFANEWESEYLRRFMKKRFTGEKIAEIKIRAENKNQITREPGKKLVLKTRIQCPFLEQNICSIYPARPMACRIYLSEDVDSCIHEFSNPEDDENYARLYDFPLHAGRKMNEGIAAYLEELGMEVIEFRLEEAILYKA